MNILLTGSAGGVGSSVLLYLLSQPRVRRITSIDILPIPKSVSAQVLPEQAKKTKHHLLDLTDFLALDALFDTEGPFDGVIHLSAIPNPVHWDARIVHNTNVSIAYNILQTAVSHGVKRIVQASSVNAIGLLYTPEGKQMFDEIPISETAPMRAVSTLVSLVPEQGTSIADGQMDPYALSKQYVSPSHAPTVTDAR
jgi:nucleoside-diphosphate-sugar epimerase